MLVYIIAFASILFLVLRFGERKDSTVIIALSVWTLFISLICGLKDMLGGYDSYIYSEIFDLTSDELDSDVPWTKTTAFISNPTELGYALFVTLLGYITANRYIFFLIYALLLYTVLYHHVKAYSKYPVVAFFILFTVFYFFTFTYMRQVLAASIAWFSIPYAIKRKPVYFFLLIGIAITFHNSALLFANVYWIANKHFTRAQISLLFVLSLILGFTPLGTFVFGIFGDALNEEKTSTALAFSNQARIEYIFEAIFFFVIIMINYEKIARDKLSLCMLNIALLFTLVLTFFVRFTDGGRMSWYFFIGIAVTISQICISGHKQHKWVIYCVLSVLFFRVLVSWGGLLSPYKTCLSIGVRDKDAIWERYEYDHQYDNDKFYRTPIKLFRSDR